MESTRLYSMCRSDHAKAHSLENQDRSKKKRMGYEISDVTFKLVDCDFVILYIKLFNCRLCQHNYLIYWVDFG